MSQGFVLSNVELDLLGFIKRDLEMAQQVAQQRVNRILEAHGMIGVAGTFQGKPDGTVAFEPVVPPGQPEPGQEEPSAPPLSLSP